MAEGILGQKALVDIGHQAGLRGHTDEPVGRRGSLDASHRAHKWQQRCGNGRLGPGLRAEMDAGDASFLPRPSPLLAAPQRPGACLGLAKGEQGVPGPLLRSHLSQVLFPSPASAFLLFHPTHQLPPTPPLPTGPPPAPWPHLWGRSPVLLQAELDSQTDSTRLAQRTGQCLLADGHLCPLAPAGPVAGSGATGKQPPSGPTHRGLH